MDSTTLREHLKQAERHLAETDRHISAQKELIARLDSQQHDTAVARLLLAEFEVSSRLHAHDCDRLRGQLAATESSIPLHARG